MAKRKIHKAAAKPSAPVEQPAAEAAPAPKAKTGDVFKDARTGEIVDAEYAGQNPGSTFKVADDLPE